MMASTGSSITVWSLLKTYSKRSYIYDTWEWVVGSSGCFVWLTDWVVRWVGSFGCSVGWLTDWLVGWLVGWLVRWWVCVDATAG